MGRVVIIAWIFFALAELLSAAEKPVWIGMTREELVDAMGAPHSQVVRGESEILLYPDAVRFELQQGKVVVVHGFKGQVTLSKPEQSEVRVDEPMTEKKAPLEGAEKKAEENTLNTKSERKKVEQGPEVRRVERQIKLPTYGDDSAPDTGKLLGVAGFLTHLHDPRWHYKDGVRPSWLMFLGGMVGRFLLCVLGLRLAAKVYDQELGWGEVMAIVGIEAGVRLLLLELLFLMLFYAMPFYAIEIVMALIQVILVYFWLNTPNWWVALRIVATAKAAIIAITFALFTVLIASTTT